MKIEYCSNCKKSLPGNAQFCNHCGRPFVQTNEQPDADINIVNRPTTLLGQGDQPPYPNSPFATVPERSLGNMTQMSTLPLPAETYSHRYIAQDEQTQKSVGSVPYGTPPPPPPSSQPEDDEDDGRKLLPFVATAVAATAVDMYQQPASDLRGPHHQPQDLRGPHQQPQSFQSSHHKPSDPRGSHHKPSDPRGSHHKPSGMQRGLKLPGKLGGGAGGSLVIGAVAILVISAMLIVFVPQLTARPKAEVSTATPNSAEGNSVLSVLNASNAFPGGKVALRGEHFLPGGTVQFAVVDTGPTTKIDQSAISPVGQQVTSYHAFYAGYSTQNIADVSGLIPDATVQDDGTFETIFTIPIDWKAGYHYSIQATQLQDSRKAIATVVIALHEAGASPTVQPTKTPTARPTGTPTAVQFAPTPTVGSITGGVTPVPTVVPTPTPTTIVPTPTPTPTPGQRQLTVLATKQGSAEATGQSGTNTMGMVAFYPQYIAESGITFSKGYTIANANPDGPQIRMVLDTSVTLYPNSEGPVYGWAHVYEVGAIEIPEGSFYAYYGSCQRISAVALTCITIRDGGDFTEGSGPFPVITQSDIDAATNQAQTAAVNAGNQALQDKLHSNEHFVGNPQCTLTQATPNHNAGDQAATVTVSVTVNCTVTAST